VPHIGEGDGADGVDDEVEEEVVEDSDREDEMDDDSRDGEGEGDENKVRVCHIPPGNPREAHTLSVGESAIRAHLSHGDYMGGCGSDVRDEEEVEIVISDEIEIDIEEMEDGEMKIELELSNGEKKELRVSSKEAGDIARRVLNVERLEKIELREEVHRNIPRVVYNIETNRNGRFLGIFKMKARLEAAIDSETGEVVDVNIPWWIFLLLGDDEPDDEMEEEMEDDSGAIETDSSDVDETDDSSDVAPTTTDEGEDTDSTEETDGVRGLEVGSVASVSG